MAIAVGVANGPRSLPADEPADEPDTATGAEIVAALRAANRELGVTVLIVTHDAQVSEQVRRTVRIREGRTSTEVLRRRAGVGEVPGEHGLVAEEYAVLDRAGRLQLPREFSESLDLRHRVRLALEADQIGVWPDNGRPEGDHAMTEQKSTTLAPMVEVEEVWRSFGSGPTAVHALRGVSFSARRGELTALRGRSGSGKTTLLNLVGGLDAPTSGRITLDGADLAGLDESGRLALRRDRIGFVFQSFGLIPILTAAENVGVPMRLRKVPTAQREERVRMLLALVGLAEHAEQRPSELSGGQQQRVAIARALANEPALIIADEPTGQLDSETGRSVMELLRTVVRSEGVTVLVATHDPQLMELADRVVELRDGHIVE